MTPMRWLCVAFALAASAPAEARMPVRIPKLTLAPLDWGMNVEQAQKALDAAKMAPVYSEIHRYLHMDKDHPHVRHTREPGWTFTPRKGWVGSAHFSWDATAEDYRIDRVTETSGEMSAAALDDEIAALEDRYGLPVATAPQQKTWDRAGTRLDATWSVDDKTRRTRLYLSLVVAR
jgi:hypothetical protein